MIVKEGGQYLLKSKDGKKVLGKFKTREEAEKREKQISQFKESIHFDVRLLETKNGSVWNVVLIEAGTSINGVTYGEEELKESLSFFDDAKAFAYDFDGNKDHLPDQIREGLPKGVSKNLVGYYSLPRIGEFQKPDGTTGRGIVAKFHVTANWLKETLQNSWEQGKRDLLGFSIDAVGRVREMVTDAGDKIKQFMGFDRLDEVTVVTHPSAGGRLINLAESYHKLKEGVQMKELLKKLKEGEYANFFEHIEEDSDTIAADISAAQGKLTESLTAKKPVEKSGSTSLDDINKLIEAAVNKAVAPFKAKEDEAAQLAESRKKLETAVNSTTDKGDPIFDEATRTKILSQHSSETLQENQINKIVKVEQEYQAKLKESRANYPGQEYEQTFNIGDDEYEKQVKAMTGMLLGEKQDGVTPFGGLHESYAKLNPGFNANAEKYGKNILREAAVATPGGAESSNSIEEGGSHKRMLREYRATSVQKLQEAQLDTSLWTEVYGDSKTRAFMIEYGRTGLEDWRKIVQISSVSDFRTNRRIRLGGFGNLSAVSEGGTYQFLDYPTDQEVTYAVTKRGNLTELTLESMVNDDLGAVQRIIRKLPVAAAQTLYEFVFDFVRTNVTLDYDSTALFHADHGNLGSTALGTANSLDNRIIAMADQTEQDSGKALAVRPQYLLVPNELMRTSWEQVFGTVSSVSGRTETLENWLKQYSMDVIIVPYWSDANDWALVADPRLMPTIEIAFLNGKQEPELFVQNQPTIGANFSADKITYKIRHIYGGDATEHRGMDKSVVA